MEFTRENFRTMIYYIFQKGLSTKKILVTKHFIWLQFTAGKEFEWGRNLVQHQKGAGFPTKTDIEKNIAAVKKTKERQ